MLRLVFIGQSGPFAPAFLRRLVMLRPAVELALVVEGKRDEGSLLGAHRRFEAAPRAIPDGPHLRSLGTALGVPVLETSDINARGAHKVLAEAAPDLIVCAGFDRLFTPELLAHARIGAMNVHPSRLPEWRGPSPIFWAVREGRRELHTTVHVLDSREDHGPVLEQAAFRLPPQASAIEIYGAAATLGADLVAARLSMPVERWLVGTPQDETRASRAPRPRPEDVLVEPLKWATQHLVDFACAAPFFRAPWLRLGRDEPFFVTNGVRAEIGRRLPGDYAEAGAHVHVQCSDGVAVLEVQR